MSIENIEALIGSARDDRALADRMRQAEVPAKLVQIGAERGYEFTEEELNAYFERLPAEELSEQDLELVSGGTSEPICYLQYKLDRCFVKSWSTSGSS